jgi:hypothetical protein
VTRISHNKLSGLIEACEKMNDKVGENRFIPIFVVKKPEENLFYGISSLKELKLFLNGRTDKLTSISKIFLEN